MISNHKSTVFIIDIDTTIADNSHRAAYLEKECFVCLNKVGISDTCNLCGTGENLRISQSSWDLFLDPSSIKQDIPVQKAQEAICKMRDFGFQFHFITGRNESLRKVTEEWLTEHFLRNPDREELCMRGVDMQQKRASLYKERALNRLTTQRGLEGCQFIFMEDDPHVFSTYQKYGIVIKCPEGWESWIPSSPTTAEPKYKA